jgi:diadenosine tetraphosphate (Ap4A) HIT family hydrolase
MSNIETCPFCNLADRILLENEHANLFLSNPRKVEGQILVIPKRHIEKPWEMDDKELIAVFSLIKIAQHKLIAEFGGGVDVKQNYRPFMKQGRVKVDHIHYHVYPRTNDDELYQQVERHETPLFVELSKEEEARISSLFDND